MAFGFTGRRVLVAGGRVPVCARGAQGLAPLRAEGVVQLRPTDLAEAGEVAARVAEAADARGGGSTCW